MIPAVAMSAETETIVGFGLTFVFTVIAIAMFMYWAPPKSAMGRWLAPVVGFSAWALLWLAVTFLPRDIFAGIILMGGATFLVGMALYVARDKPDAAKRQPDNEASSHPSDHCV